MSGHSKWANIKHRKGATDAKRAALFTKLSKNISLAARSGGDPEFNFSLRTAIDKALAANMLKDKIELAIKRGTGEIAGGSLEEILYEGYGPVGTAILIEAQTDNRNRTSASLKHILSKYGGSLAGSGSVQWMFERKGILQITDQVELSDDDQLHLIDAGAEDITISHGKLIISCPDIELAKVRQAAKNLGLKIDEFGLEWVAKDQIQIDESMKQSLIDLFETLDDDEDVANIYSNVNI
ncbi:YebC/PmpR family DNA-binding transcriptional regulator [Patescibacteria group bacterium]|nr:YebC/PmpR family DNA-binding transcriptional regulator [Patescibacteria group bacterium]MBU1029138.1 YebC/PmpR family DNA-binding transcriptional regulator [Patescibacteria group bacterium]MBU1916132.1 YebC/PmpR family DNA-binding transcriptional regulator [Patescibacteria group bacterium]